MNSNINYQAMKEKCETRFIRGDKIGEGAAKVVYKAIDRDEGVDVAWNQMKLDRRNVDYRKLIQEAKLLKKLSHNNIIKFVEAWIDEDNAELILITELMNSGNLHEYVEKAQGVHLNVLKGWCRQILDGLMYLHNDAKIIHRDIKCDNIFINGAVGLLKIGDLGLATVIRKNRQTYSVIGTPEYMAPEFYDEKYDHKVDIWAFGLSVLEMATMEYPFSECENAAQIYKKVTRGEHPQLLHKLKDAELKRFILRCLAADVNERPSAESLRADPFLTEANDTEEPAPIELVENVDVPTRQLLPLNTEIVLDDTVLTGKNSTSVARGTSQKTPFESPHYFALDVPLPSVNITVISEKSAGTFSFGCEASYKGRQLSIVFDFDSRTDTAMQVAKELRASFNYPVGTEDKIAALILQELRKHKPDYKDDPLLTQQEERSQLEAQQQNELEAIKEELRQAIAEMTTRHNAEDIALGIIQRDETSAMLARHSQNRTKLQVMYNGKKAAARRAVPFLQTRKSDSRIHRSAINLPALRRESAGDVSDYEKVLLKQMDLSHDKSYAIPRPDALPLETASPVATKQDTSQLDNSSRPPLTDHSLIGTISVASTEKHSSASSLRDLMTMQLETFCPGS